MAFQIVNFLSARLGAGLFPGENELIVTDDDLPKVAVYQPGYKLALTLVGSDSDQHEIVYAVSLDGTKFIVERAQEGTFEQSWYPGTQVVSALTAAVLQNALENPVSSATVSYVATGLIAGANVQQALEDAGTQIAALAVQDVPRPKAAAKLFSPGPVQTTDDPLFGSSSGRLVTNGLGAINTMPETAHDCRETAFHAIVHARLFNASDFLRLYVFVATEFDVYRWSVGPTQFLGEGEWTTTHLPWPSAVRVYAPSAGQKNKAWFSTQDDGTGVTTTDIAALELYPVDFGELGAFIRPTSVADGDAAVALGRLGYPVHLVLEEFDIPSVYSAEVLTRWKNAGARFVIASAAVTRTQSLAQLNVNFYRILRKLSAANIEAWGFLYTDNFYGSLAMAPQVRMQQIVMQFFARGFVLLDQDDRGAGESFPPVLVLRNMTAAFPAGTLGPNVDTSYSTRLFLANATAKNAFAAITDVVKKNYIGYLRNRLLSTVTSLTAYVTQAITDIQTTVGQQLTTVTDAFNAHAARTDNPHTVTKGQVGLGNVSNLAPANMPVSTAQGEAIALKAPLLNPTFAGKITTGQAYGASGSIGKSDAGAAPLIIPSGDLTDGVSGAYLGFQTGDFSAYLGIDGDNSLKIGGWSYGTNAYKIWHEGNDGDGSGLDADKMRGQAPSVAETGNTIVSRDSSGGIYAGNRVYIKGTSPGIQLYDTDWSTQPNYIYMNGGAFYFQNANGIKFYVDDGGNLWTAQFGDLYTWMSNNILGPMNSKVTQLRRASFGFVGTNTYTPGGTVSVGVASAFDNNYVTGSYFAYLQTYSLATGWVNMGDG